jgi:peptidylprolyl isomerase
VFFDVNIDEKNVGRLIIGLFGHDVPITVANFLGLSEGSFGVGEQGFMLNYKGSIFHKSYPGKFAFGGDITAFDGIGGESIYGRFFDDENFLISHSEPYLLSMNNIGPNSNASQFLLTFGEATYLDGYNVVFGQVVGGFEVVEALENIGT